MKTTVANLVLDHVRGLVAPPVGDVLDAQLLERFTATREEAAFAALVRRHGPMVYGVCRRVLHNEHDAEDAFQATFLVLARKASSINLRNSVGSWLYQVAQNVSMKARERTTRQQLRDGKVTPRQPVDPLAEITGRELLATFDAELARLPERHRAPLVLCYLQGLTRDAAARELGCSESTLHRRLEAAREQLRRRLERRGLALPATLLAAATLTTVVPASLAAATVQSALVPVVTAVSRTTRVAVVALLVGLVAVVVGLTLVRSPVEPPKEAPARDDKQQMIVSGRVRDADGKPLPGAAVAVVVEPKVPHRGGELSSGKARVLGEGKADAEGRYRLDVPRTSSLRQRKVWLLAGGPGHGVGWHELNADAERPEAELRLERVQSIRGRFVDLQGQPAARVRVRVDRVGHQTPGEFKGVAGDPEVQELPFWPKAAVTDKDGRYELQGIGRGTIAFLGVGDDRFATQGFHVDANAKDGVKELNASLEPAHIIEGVVTCADTGKPVPSAQLTVYAARDELGSWFGLDGRADDKGRFRINPSPGKVFQVTAYANGGEPYLPLRQTIRWPLGTVKQQIELKLPRGVLVRGKITEAASGSAVAQASVQYVPSQKSTRRDVPTGWETPVVSDETGAFSVCVLPGPGHLLVHAATPHFILKEMGYRQLQIEKPGGVRYYAHAFVKVDPKAGADPQEVAVKLNRGVSVTGRVVGPDGKPVAEAMMLCRLHVTALSPYWRGFPSYARDGKFELHGLDPQKSYPVHFLDAKNKLGATVEVAGKQAGEELVVKLAPCGQAVTRVVNREGKPLAGRRVWLQIVAAPGPHEHDLKAYERGELAADAATVANVDRVNHWDGPLTDRDGRITFPALIPGATYRITEFDDRDNIVKQGFKAESGKTLQLPDVILNLSE